MEVLIVIRLFWLSLEKNLKIWKRNMFQISKTQFVGGIIDFVKYKILKLRDFGTGKKMRFKFDTLSNQQITYRK